MLRSDEGTRPAETTMSRSQARLFARQLAREEAPSSLLPTVPSFSEDTLWRGLTRNGEMRLLVARATRSLRDGVAVLGAAPEGARLLGQLTVGGLLVRSVLDPQAQMQLTIRNTGAAGRMYLDVWGSGAGYRATLENPDATERPDLPLFAEGEFDLMRSRASGTPHRSVRLLSGETLPEAYMAHLLESDQIRAVLRLDVRVDEEGLTHACGFLVQVTPEGGRDDVQRLLENLEGLPRLGDVMGEDDPDGRTFADRLFDGYRWDQSAREEVAFVCRCSRERLVAILRSLPEQERAEIAEEGVPVETTCEFCRARYEIAPAELES